MRLVYSEMAALDIEEMWLDVLEKSQDADIADDYRRGLLSAVSEKKRFPESGKPIMRRNGEFTGFYAVFFKKYAAFYRTEGDAMEVVRVMYLGSNYMKRLFGE